MARPSNTDERRAQITSALIRVMARRGYDGASTALIAEEAGLAPGLVHYHYETKQRILIEAVERLMLGIRERYDRRLREAGDDREAQLRAFIDAHLALGPDADESAVAAWVVIGSEAVRQDAVRKLYQRSISERTEVLERLMRAVLRERGKSTKGIKQKAAAVLSAIEGCYQISCAAPATMPRGSAAPTVRAMVEGLLHAQST
ncbi:MAG: TetR/AcrR family transcriptional regulator [Planctomycetota bacterium]